MSEICRLCLSNGRFVSIFSCENSLQMSYKVMSLASVRISEGDNLPAVVCSNCVERLNNCYAFKIQCEESDSHLRQRYSEDELKGDPSLICNVKCELEEIIFFDETKKLKDEELNGTRSSRGKDNITQSTVKQKLKQRQGRTKRHVATNATKAIVNNLRKSRTKSQEYIIEEVVDLHIDLLKHEDESYEDDDGEDEDDEEDDDDKNDEDFEDIPSKRKGSKKIINHIDDLPLDPPVKKKRIRKRGPRKPTIRKKIEPGSTSRPCHTCGKFISANWMKCHMRIHTGERPYSCQYCSKTFRLPYNLKAHERTHTGEKPLLCGTCGKTFSQRCSLTAHMRLHTGELPYKCTLCPMQLRTFSNFQYHMRQHTGEKNFECEVCNRAFINKGDLNQHIKTHTGERSHVCSVCGLRLTRAYTLNRHMLTHTGEKPHKCEICGMAYVKRTDLTKHLKKHAEEIPAQSIQMQPMQPPQSQLQSLQPLQGIQVPVSIVPAMLNTLS